MARRRRGPVGAPCQHDVDSCRPEACKHLHPSARGRRHDVKATASAPSPTTTDRRRWLGGRAGLPLHLSDSDAAFSATRHTAVAAVATRPGRKAERGSWGLGEGGLREGRVAQQGAAVRDDDEATARYEACEVSEAQRHGLWQAGRLPVALTLLDRRLCDHYAHPEPQRVCRPTHRRARPQPALEPLGNLGLGGTDAAVGLERGPAEARRVSPLVAQAGGEVVVMRLWRGAAT